MDPDRQVKYKITAELPLQDCLSLLGFLNVWTVLYRYDRKSCCIQIQFYQTFGFCVCGGGGAQWLSGEIEKLLVRASLCA